MKNELDSETSDTNYIYAARRREDLILQLLIVTFRLRKRFQKAKESTCQRERKIVYKFKLYKIGLEPEDLSGFH
jgi:hypothetical protein